MLDPNQPIAIFAEATMGLLNAKMAEGILRYGRNPAVAVIDSTKAGKTVGDVCRLQSDVPIVATLEEAIALGAQVLVLGTAPSGGRVPGEWMDILHRAVGAGLSIVNGMHDELAPTLGRDLAEGQWIWDIRMAQGTLPDIAMGRAAALSNARILMVGTDMAVGKMTAGLEIHRSLCEAGADAAFLASGQTGIAIMGTGIPLDAFRVDHAAGAVERMVLGAADHDYVIVEGQGSLLHPGSTATLPLMRGSCCTSMILCHRAGMKALDTLDNVRVPPLRDVIALNEMTATANGTLTAAKVLGIALNTSHLSEDAAKAAIEETMAETGLPVSDLVRFGAAPLADAIMAFHTK
ncbi:DUF1611 domain-containing protein [Roseobacter litoralis]|uniref:DUF1611 domain-containing protein n=1 Tax=Roseobacter litoralis (strain ATCC 49566 / DSM 6996 / JCM 21268 / NBRC 15278 / OCh 149) TaxID=391595 RepID=F7ZLS4_ROSLO|nr:DUF1611 domain-containing protein [Roseobacter litoralis]AEI94125.1 hypothetical protein RLO149_c021490 [Roseobacter litoralis Och 149]